jgi:hypothetical protein
MDGKLATDEFTYLDYQTIATEWIALEIGCSVGGIFSNLIAGFIPLLSG